MLCLMAEDKEPLHKGTITFQRHFKCVVSVVNENVLFVKVTGFKGPPLCLQRADWASSNAFMMGRSVRPPPQTC